MSNEKQPEAGFKIQKLPKDELTAQLFVKYELPEAASMEDIEPVAVRLWEDRHTKLDAMQLVLGRYVNASEFETNPYLGYVSMIQDPAEGFESLIMLRTMEDIAAESQA